MEEKINATITAEKSGEGINVSICGDASEMMEMLTMVQRSITKDFMKDGVPHSVVTALLMTAMQMGVKMAEIDYAAEQLKAAEARGEQDGG